MGYSIDKAGGDEVSQENFIFNKDSAAEDNEKRAACCSCPLAQIPASVWLALLRPPFSKRHPWLFWLLVFIAAISLVLLGKTLFGEDGDIGGRDSLALVNIQGAIMDAGPTLAWIRKIENEEGIKGVLLRVNSPGGGAAASQEIYAALARVAAKIPVVVSMGATAASGGLMVSMAGERIFANPSTVTGSIGVRMDIPQLQGLMNKIGVGQETLVTAPYKDAASYTHPLTPQDREYLESVIRDMHEQFVDIVAKGRKMPREQAARLASGKIFTGQEAMALGLVDAMGGQDEAHAWLAQKTGVPLTRKLATRPLKKTRLLDSIFSMAALAGLAGEGPDDLVTLGEKWTQPVFLYQF